MRTTLPALSLLLMTCLALPAYAGVDTGTLSQRIEQAGYKDDAQDLEVVRDSLEEATVKPQSDKYLYYYLGYADYSLANQYAATDNSKATDRIQSAQDALKAALKLDPGFAEAEALLGASYGFEIGLHPYKGMFLGSKSAEHMKHAVQLAPQDPRVMFLNATSDFNTPAAFGGDKQKAIWGFHGAIAAFDTYQATDAVAPSWGKAQAYEWLAYAEEDAGQKEAARSDYGKALALVPDYKKAQRHLDKLPPAGTAPVPAHASL